MLKIIVLGLVLLQLASSTEKDYTEIVQTLKSAI